MIPLTEVLVHFLSRPLQKSTTTQKKFPVRPLDSLELTEISFIKIDAEGMESHVLRGGLRTISKSRPIIMCECNFLHAGAPILDWAWASNYLVHGIVFSAFNPENYLGNTHNMLAETGEISLLLTPREKTAQLPEILKGAEASEITSLDHLGLVMLKKPQYTLEVSQGLVHHNPIAPTAPSSNISVEHHLDVESPAPKKTYRIQIAVPFYKNPHLVRPLFKSLLECRDEINALDARIVFLNDSPDDPNLAEELNCCLREKGTLDLTVVSNKKNLGFIGTSNLALEAGIDQNEDVILLNSDTHVFPGALFELCQVAYSDPMIGFVSPRSNNATICTFPHGIESEDLSPEESLKKFEALSKYLPRFSYAPTAVGFCLYIKANILRDLGTLDPQYGRGYNEENDLIMRANRLGYRAALANHAFVWHQGEQSFRTLAEGKPGREQKNVRLLHARYPEYPKLIHEYFSSPEYRSESLLSALSPDEDGFIKIGFDFSNFGTYHNGTFEAGKELLFACARCWPENIEIVVFMSRQSWDFHQLEKCRRARWNDTHQPDQKLAAIVRMGQPFEHHSIFRMLVRAPVVGIFMLDTISTDCGYLKIGFDENIWHFVLRWSDIIFTNSIFTAKQFQRRYIIGEKTIIYPSLHSVTPKEYLPKKLSSVRKNKNAAEAKTVLVIGNKFEHKFVNPMVNYLANSKLSIQIIAFGYTGPALENLTSYESGSVPDDTFEELYADLDAIIFPSHYEGFGFNIMHALAKKKPIYLRRLPSFLEIAAHIISGQENIRWYDSEIHLIEQLSTGIPEWQGGDALGETDGWDRSAREVLSALKNKIDTISLKDIADRLRWFELSFMSPITAPRDYNEPRLERRYGTLIKLVLINKYIYSFARGAWKLFNKRATPQ